MQQTKIGLTLLAGCLFAGCVDQPIDSSGDEVGQTTQAVEVDNGISLNGISLNGISLNGISLNGISLNGISLNGISLNGISLNGISLNGISLNGISLNGTTLQGVVGATMQGVLSNGAPLSLRIDSATTGTGSNRDVGMYGVSYQSDAGWQPLCGRDAGGQPILALAVPGTWNTQSGVAGGGAYTPSDAQFTFACRGKTIAKCVELGYKTWNGHTKQLTSCVRLLRADFCGDGTSHTTDGTLLNLYDNLAIQLDTEAWDKEAEWTPDGARCITYQKESRLFSGTKLPACLLDGRLDVSWSCGRSFLSGATLISELPPR